MSHLSVPGAAAVILVFVWILGLGLIPQLFQSLLVEPNEITMEKPYIVNNIRLTRHGFNLQKVEERQFPVTSRLTRAMVSHNPELFNNIRLWDWRALDDVYQQFQKIRLYYEFIDVDVDRYYLGGDYRQVMVSAREMEFSNLPSDSQTFVNRRFKYTHGYGITMADVSDFTPQGLPDLLVRDIPPKSSFPELRVGRPQIYYGELTDTYVIVNSEESEFDYPLGESNMYIRYSGKGGVQMSNWWRKFVYSYKLGGMKLLLSSYSNSQSRIMFHRRIQERVKTLAPFLDLDSDPYIVLVDGRLYWILDTYTTSSDFPYSSSLVRPEISTAISQQQTLQDSLGPTLQGINYIRNSVKVVVDAFDGDVDFYIFDPQDALIRVWARIYPNLFKPAHDMPDALRRHIRYPIDMFSVQGMIYARYHMTNPTVFYNQEDLWVQATEKYYNSVQPVEPYYIMWQPPERDNLEFILMQPYTPKNRQVMIGWIAGMCDGENYGRFLSYKFPKENRVLGPQQVETKIDQDRFLSGQLSLWNQRGSQVIRGNVLAIPVGTTILYVEPIYLQAETAAYPELRLFVVMHQDELSYAETFDQALRGLYGNQRPREEQTAQSGELVGPDQPEKMNMLIRQAHTAFENYLRYLGEKQFDSAADALNELQQSLRQLKDNFGGDIGNGDYGEQN
jgi:uncharacterized membrane protein (UPF0182 family)